MRVTTETILGVRRTPVDHLAIARHYAAHPNHWPLAPRFNPVHRWYHRLAVEADVEVWLLTWLPGQGTDLHDHGGSSGAFLVIAGELTEPTVAGPDGRSGRDGGQAIMVGWSCCRAVTWRPAFFRRRGQRGQPAYR